MASRLSEEALKEVYDQGIQGLAWSDSDLGKGATPLSVDIDFGEILKSEDAAARIGALHPFALFCAIRERGLEDSIDVLALASKDQITRFLDYDAWSDDQLVPQRVFFWLMLFRELGQDVFFGRFKELEEEYQLALLKSTIRLLDIEEHEKLPSEEQDLYTALPCGKLLFRVDSQETAYVEAVEALIKAGLTVDINYTYCLLAHAAFMPPNEDEQKISQFRKARLEEDGFVVATEALSIFRPLSNADEIALRDAVAKAIASLGMEGGLAVKRTFTGDLLESILALGAERWDPPRLDAVFQSLAHLANQVASATGVQPGDLRQLHQVVILSRAVLNLGLESLAGSSPYPGCAILAQVHPALVFQFGLSRVEMLRKDVVARLVTSGLQGFESADRLLRNGRHGELMLLVDKHILPILGLDVAECLKGLFNRFPMRLKGDKESSKVTLEPISTLKELNAVASEVDGVLEQIASLREQISNDADDKWDDDLSHEVASDLQ